MKLLFSSSVLVAVFGTGATVWASPALVTPRIEPYPTSVLYRLRAYAPSAADIDGRYFVADANGTIGLFRGSDSRDKATLFYKLPADRPPLGGRDAPERIQLFVAPPDSRELVAVGSSGLLDLRVISDPASTTAPPGTSMDWKSFTMGQQDSRGIRPTPDGARGATLKPDPVTSISDRGHGTAFPEKLSEQGPSPSNLFSFSGSRGRWIVMDAGNHNFEPKWYDGNAIVVQTYRPISILYEEVSSS